MRTNEMRLAALLAASFALKLAYVFFLTHYASYLFSDFAGYWLRAHERMAGDDLGYSQWAFWPPVPHILLGWYLKLIGLLGLSAHELEAALVLNVAASTASVALVYGIVLETLKDHRWALGVAALYAFTFPLVYLNAFVMSEHGATLFMLAAVWLVLRYRGHMGVLVAAGAALGVATAMRPGLGVLGLPVVLYLALTDGTFTRAKVIRAAAFSCGFFMVVAWAAAEVYRISGGKVSGLSANGPLSFYFAQCRTATAHFSYQGHRTYFTAPSYAGRPENGTVQIDLGNYDLQVLRYLAWRCLRDEPERLRAAAQRAGDLFFGALLPDVPRAAGFTTLLPPFRWLFFACVLVAPLGFAVRREHGVSTAALGLVGGMLAVSLTVLAVYSIEHRYLYPLVPFLYVVAAAVLLAASRAPRRFLAAGRVLAAALAAVCAAALAVEAVRWLAITPAVRTEIRRFASLDVAPAKQDKLAESNARRLHSARDWLGAGSVNETGRAVHLTCMEVRARGIYELQVVAAGGFALFLNQLKLIETRSAQLDSAWRWRMELPAGRYLYRLRMDGPLGATATWRPITSQFSEYAPAIGLRYIGEPGEEAVFLPPERC